MINYPIGHELMCMICITCNMHVHVKADTEPRGLMGVLVILSGLCID